MQEDPRGLAGNRACRIHNGLFHLITIHPLQRNVNYVQGGNRGGLIRVSKGAIEGANYVQRVYNDI